MSCIRCILDDRIPGITYNEKGECNYCQMYDELVQKYTHEKWLKIVEKIRYKQRNKPYDVIVGVSGGCDSSFMLHLCKSEALRVLAVHFDNGWDTKDAISNIRKVTEKLGFDVVSYKIPEHYMNDINYAFLKAGVPDCDIPNDIALTAILYKAACDFKTPFIFDGHDFKTEGTCPTGWSYMDGKYIIDVHKKYGRFPEAIEFFPNLTLKNWLYWIIVKRIKRYRPLYYFHMDKEFNKDLLKRKYGFKWYGGHHLENKYTAFCSRVMFPTFGMGRTIIELAALVRSRNMERDDALLVLMENEIHIKRAKDEIKLIKQVEQKLSINVSNLIQQTPKTHKDFETYEKTFKRYKWFFWILMKAKLVPETFYIKYCKVKK